MNHIDAPIPPFLETTTSRNKSLDSLIAKSKWEMKHSADIRQKEERKARLILDRPVNDTDIIYYSNSAKKIICRVKGNQIEIAYQNVPNYYLPGHIDNMETILNFLTSAQRFPKEQSEVKGARQHRDIIDFLSVNWKELVTHFYPFLPDKKMEPIAFTEVAMGSLSNKHKGIADLLGFGPDGTLFILELGRRDKGFQLQGYVNSLLDIFPELTDGRIISLTATIPNPKKNNLMITPHYVNQQ